MSQISFPPFTAPAVDETLQVASTSSMSMNSIPPLSIAPVLDEIVPVAESTQARSVVSNQALQEWRAIRAQQDLAYNTSLLVDQEKERKKLAYQACEERRQKAIEARRQRLSACEEPSDGVLIKFKYPNGHINMRKFSLLEPIQILFDFVGQDDIASEIFVVQEATSRSIESSSSGSIMDHGIKASSTLYVLWFSNQDVQEILSDQLNYGAYALHHAYHGQSLLCETSTQPSLSVPPLQPLLSETSTQPSLSVPPLQPLLSETSTQPSLSVPPLQPLLSETSTQPSLSVPNLQPLLSEASIQPSLSVPPLQPLLSETSTQPSLSVPPLQPLLSETSTQPSLSVPNLQPLLSEASIQPSLSVPPLQPLLSETSTQPSLSVPPLQPLLSETFTQPSLSVPPLQPLLSETSTQPSLSVPPLQPLLSETSTQPSLSVPPLQPLLSETFTQPSLSVPPLQPLLSEASIQPSLSVPPLQPLLSETSTQPSLSVPPLQPLLSETSTQPSLSVPPLQPLLSETSTQPSLSVPPLQPLLSETFTQPSLSVPPLQPLLSEPSIQPPLALFSPPQEMLTLHDEPSLLPSSAQEPIIILDEQDETVSQNQSPVSQNHLEGPVAEIDLQTILRKLVSKVDGNVCSSSNQINVCRNNVFLCSLRAFKRRFFNPEAKLDVVFVDENDNGEGAVDEGGPTREYLRLLMRAVHQSNIFEGHESPAVVS
ncbi:coagulation factor V-like [Pseudorasbora parva]|uniref:coagulation factor V-like n=1 Tax=Pseudorasbora parva TaxID=51549 RepID=UPI00351E5AB5